MSEYKVHYKDNKPPSEYDLISRLFREVQSTTNIELNIHILTAVVYYLHKFSKFQAPHNEPLFLYARSMTRLLKYRDLDSLVDDNFVCEQLMNEFLGATEVMDDLVFDPTI